MLNLKSHEFHMSSFITGHYIPTTICDDLINYFELNPQRQREGTIGSNSLKKDKDAPLQKFGMKKSMDISLSPMTDDDDGKLLDKYILYMNKCVQEYELKYTRAKHLSVYGITENVNIQKYNPNEGFFEWHQERGGLNTTTRCFAFMTYLNDVEDGGTEFLYQKLTVPAKKGLTLIWPTDWTHTHRGQISKTKTKYIITGWLNYLD